MSIEIKAIPEQAVPGKPLGRHVQHDPRSRNFAIEPAAKIESVKHVAVGLPLQQTRGSCTAEALCGARNSDPNYSTGDEILDQADADKLYDAEIVLEGEDPSKDDPGGTGLLVCKAAVQAGLITRYEHAFGLQHALGALTLRPVITGVNWYENFDRVDSSGIVTIGGQVRGGHEVVAYELDVEGKLVWFWNSWGTGWGLGGRFAMSFDTWGQLLSEEGDVTVPVR